MKKILSGALAFLAVLGCALSAPAQTLINPHYVAYPAGATTRLDDQISSINTTLAGKQGLDSDLTCVAALSTTGFINRTGAGTCTAAVLVATDIPALDWTKITTGKPTTLAGYGITDAQPLDSDLTAIAALTTTTYGRSLLTQASATALVNSLSASDLTTGTLPAGRLPAYTGDVASSVGSTVNTLATVNANTGACGDASHVAVVTLDAKGRATACTATAITPAAIGAPSGSGTSSGSNTGDQTITLTGDVTGSGTGSFAATLAASGVTAAAYGDASHVAQVTFDAKGRATSAAAVAITPAAIGAEASANKGAASGYAQLDSSTLLPRTIKYAHINVLTASTTITAGSVYDIQFFKRGTAGGLTATLPTAPADGWTMEFCDGKGDAATNADTIAAGGTDTINGAASVLINTNYGCKRVTYSASLTMWIAR